MLLSMNESLRRSGIIAVAIVAVYAVGTWFRGTLGIEFDAESVRDYVLGLGPLAPILFVFIVAFRSRLGLPAQVVLIAAGLCFGTAVGALVGGAGLMTSGLILFIGARYAGREAIEKRLGPRVKHTLDFTQRRSGIVALALACGYPISPLSPIHAAAGFTPMPTANFMAAAFLGGLIRSAVFAYFGNAMTEASRTALLTPLAFLAVAMAIPLATRSGRAWLRNIFAPQKESTAQDTNRTDIEDSAGSADNADGGDSIPATEIET
jgi:uncharacterized membrane protein YdjX (TVP38/TMEM64 family)